MSLWLSEKFHDCRAKLYEFKLKELRTELQMQEGPLPWQQFTELSQLLTEIRDNIARFEAQNDVFLKTEHIDNYLDHNQ